MCIRDSGGRGRDGGGSRHRGRGRGCRRECPRGRGRHGRRGRDLVIADADRQPDAVVGLENQIAALGNVEAAIGDHALIDRVEFQAVDGEVIDAVVDVVVNLHVLDDAAHLHRTPVVLFGVKDGLVVGYKAEVPHALAGFGLVGGAGFFLVIVAPVFYDEDVFWIDGECRRAFAQKGDAGQIGDFLQCHSAGGRTWPHHADPGQNHEGHKSKETDTLFHELPPAVGTDDHRLIIQYDFRDVIKLTIIAFVTVYSMASSLQ